MRRRTALAGGWLATTALATAVCAVAVSLVTSDLTDPRRDAVAVAELHSIEAAAGSDGSGLELAQRVHLGAAIDQVAPDTRTSRTVVSRGGVLVASCPAPITLRSARPHSGAQVLVDDTFPGVIEVRFVRARVTEVHRLTCGSDGVEVATAGTEEVAAPASPDPTQPTPDEAGSEEGEATTPTEPRTSPIDERAGHAAHDRYWWHRDGRDDDDRNRHEGEGHDGERHDRGGDPSSSDDRDRNRGDRDDGWRAWGGWDAADPGSEHQDEGTDERRHDRGPGGRDDAR